MQLGKGEVKVETGTSVATAIAAGLTAVILEYARQCGNTAWRVEDHKRLVESLR